MMTIFDTVYSGMLLKKAVFSKPQDKNTLRCVAKPFEKRGQFFIQFETFTTDGKALHHNESAGHAAAYACDLLQNKFKQCNLFTTGGDCEIKISKAGKTLIHNKINLTAASCFTPAAHNKEKNTILCENTFYPFLAALGISDRTGRIFDRKRAKFKQINRFLEIIDDIYPRLHPTKTLTIYDLCCGKSYLTFAAYHYFTEIKKRTVSMIGIDRKADVIAFCTKTAAEAGFTNLTFLCQNIDAIRESSADLVLSLHACDTATDLVLNQAVKMKADVILSTPCCHHEMMGQLTCEPLGFITKHSLLKQKLCDAATDSLRALRLEAEGYKVTVLELIDPEQTPKNMMIKAIKKPISIEKREKLLQEYDEACRFLNASPTLNRLLTENINDTDIDNHPKA
ncbi:MAG: SAM-dependent methyltransferase [Clostridiales bacterium]|nr:SAM-dependent methyltransferase [Clostridiales bacterium]